MPDDKIRGGERPGYREAMDRMTRQMVESGRSRDDAQRIAREQAIRADRDGRRPSKPKP